MNSKPAFRETPAHVSAILAEVEKQSPSVINEWQVIRHISDMLTLHILVNRQTLALSLPGQLTPDSFDNHYFYEITFMTVDKTTFKNLPSFAGVPSHAEFARPLIAMEFITRCDANAIDEPNSFCEHPRTATEPEEDA